PCTYLRLHPPTTPTSFPYTTLFRSYKIPVEDPSLEDFMRIFELNCRSRNLRYHEVMVAYLQRRHYTPVVRPMRACHPRDLLDQVTALCRFRGLEPTISRDLLDAACASY